MKSNPVMAVERLGIFTDFFIINQRRTGKNGVYELFRCAGSYVLRSGISLYYFVKYFYSLGCNCISLW